MRSESKPRVRGSEYNPLDDLYAHGRKGVKPARFEELKRKIAAGETFEKPEEDDEPKRLTFSRRFEKASPSEREERNKQAREDMKRMAEVGEELEKDYQAAKSLSKSIPLSIAISSIGIIGTLTDNRQRPPQSTNYKIRRLKYKPR